MDATCAPSKIKYPQDTALLNEARENAPKRYKSRIEQCPERVLADKIFQSRDNLSFCKERGIRLVFAALVKNSL